MVPIEEEAPASFAATILASNASSLADLKVCQDIRNFFETPYNYFPVFENTAAIESAHNGIPRAGHTNNVMVVVTGTKEEATDYIVGLMVAALMVFSFFVLWIVLLLVLKGFGAKRVGFLSGRRAPLPPKPTTTVDDDDDEHDDEPTTKKEGQEVGPILPALTGTEMATTTTTESVVGVGPGPGSPQQGLEQPLNPQEGEMMMMDDDDNNNNIVLQEEQMPVKVDDAFGLDDDDKVDKEPPTSNSPAGAAADEDDNDEDGPLTLTEWNTLYDTKMKQQRWMKAGVVFCCCFVITMAILMAVKGIQSLRNSVQDSKDTINDAGELVDAGAAIIGALASYLMAFQTDMLFLLNSTNGMCPVLTGPSGICRNITDYTTCDETLADDVFGRALEAIGVNQTELEEFETVTTQFNYTELVRVFSSDWGIVDTLEQFQQHLLQVSAGADHLNYQLSTIDWVFYVAVVFGLIVALLALCMVGGLLLPLPRLIKCLQNRLLFPLFLFFVVLSFILAIAFLVASMAMADVCYDNPDPRVAEVAQMLIENELDDSFITEYVIYWFSQCQADPNSLKKNQEFLQEAQTSLDDFEAVLGEFFETAEDVCGTTQENVFATTFLTMGAYLCASVGALLRLRYAFECSTWMPLYYNTVYSAMCFNGTSGVWSIAATQFMTVLMTGFILTFRAVFWELEIDSGSGDKPKLKSRMSGMSRLWRSQSPSNEAADQQGAGEVVVAVPVPKEESVPDDNHQKEDDTADDEPASAVVAEAKSSEEEEA